jgi:signal transduction histidine kinase
MRLPIRLKLALALSVPLVAMGIVTVIEVTGLASKASEVRDQTNLAAATIGPNGLITALQNERNWATAYLVGVQSQLRLEVSGFDETRAATDEALGQFEAELDRRGEAARAAFAPALDGLAKRDELRRRIDEDVAGTTLDLENIGTSTGVFDEFTALIEPFLGGMSRISVAMDDPQLRQGARLTETVTRQLEIVPQLANALVFPATVPTVPGDVPGFNRPSEIADVAKLSNAFARYSEQLQNPKGSFAEIAAEQFPTAFTQVLDEQSAQAISTGNIDVNTLLTGLDVPDDQELAYVGYRDDVAKALQHRADELNASASSREKRLGVVMVLTFGAAVALTVLVSLSITRPLRSLTRQAKDMAERRLPMAVAHILDTPFGEDVQVPEVVPVDVTTRDEVADVAAALNTVQDSALDLAIEQAVLRRNIADSFVNLGRRNQNLLGRQLDFITELETHEADPDVLGNLFRLDHLATRMRRNAESLLVLAGIDPPRRWVEPLRVSDVVRAAVGEVEDFHRVVLHVDTTATISGSAAADLAHLLAELIENALVFSPPDRKVEVHGAPRHGGYAVAVVDSGLGMPSEEIEAANRRLAGAESFTIAPSKYLGHYVAGNLAARHGITVMLHCTRGFGVTATVELPEELLVNNRAVPWPTSPPLRTIGPAAL